MVTLNSPVTAHTMSIASLGLTGHGRVRRRERMERRRNLDVKGLMSTFRSGSNAQCRRLERGEPPVVPGELYSV